MFLPIMWGRWSVAVPVRKLLQIGFLAIQGMQLRKCKLYTPQYNFHFLGQLHNISHIETKKWQKQIVWELFEICNEVFERCGTLLQIGSSAIQRSPTVQCTVVHYTPFPKIQNFAWYFDDSQSHFLKNKVEIWRRNVPLHRFWEKVSHPQMMKGFLAKGATPVGCLTIGNCFRIVALAQATV